MNVQLPASDSHLQYRPITQTYTELQRKQYISPLDSNTELTRGIQYNNHLVRSYSDDDDDDVGDEFSEGELEEIERFKRTGGSASRRPANDLTSQLLQFADRINGDIEKYFGKYKSCVLIHGGGCHRKSKSGRELYYADLLRIAKGAEDDEDKLSPSSCDIYTGRIDASFGLGPLSELFEHLPDENDAAGRRSHGNPGTPVLGLPMNARKLPDSFFDEPKGNGHVNKPIFDKNRSSPGLLPDDSETPDFSDLLESWTGEDIPEQKP
ncbi:hypothetical protein LSH36_782g05016 [Paralvinella palmiformis]|uniref:Uncharacterized protein n=1 Tax=Paralvinella palmiformis TaxID=53620 RepID=A0AAD9J183_9ANNE|nr:hypothetical protein LSH36_782g05016 [Paralvinella palmiformis]